MKHSIRKLFLAALLLFVVNNYAEILNFTLCPQIKSSWCWAASSEGLLKYYNIECTQTQCAKVAVPSGNNQPMPNKAIVKILDHFNCDNDGATWFDTDSVTVDKMESAIDAKHPFVVDWGWTNGGGHFVDLYGYENDMFYIMNPWPVNTGEFQQGTYDWIKNGQNKGKWRSTVWTSHDAPTDIAKNTIASSRGYNLTFSGSQLLYRIPEKDALFQHVSLTLYTPQGRLSATLINKEMNAGTYSVNIGRIKNNLAGGLYICKISAYCFSKTLNIIIK